MNRRDFLQRTGKAAALAALTGSTAVWFHGRRRPEAGPLILGPPRFTVPPDPQFPGLALARHEDPRVALGRALDAVGGMARFVQPGLRVTVKPNIGWDRVPEQAANTRPELVADVVRRCFAAGAAEVIVTDVSCNEPRRCFIRSGIRAAAEAAGARVPLPAADDFVRVHLGGRVLADWPVLRHFIETDRLINMPIVKQHSLSLCTIGMKNLYGILGGRRNRLHQEIDQSIVDLVAFAPPTLTIVDATRVLVRNGPQGGSLADVKSPNVVICATDPVAADARAVEWLDLRAEQVGHIALAARSGLGTLDYRAAGLVELAG